MVDPVVDLIVRVGLAWMLAAAAWHKLRDRSAFRGVVAAYALCPAALVGVAATAVVGVELALVIALLVPATRTAGLFGTATVLAAYAVAMGVNLGRGRREIDCGCGGTPTPIGPWLVGRNLMLATIAITTSIPVSSRPLQWVDAFSALAATLALAACWTAATGLLALQPVVVRLRGDR